MENKKINCFECGKETEREQMHYWYAFDQDNLVCESCARKLKHLETGLRGMPVLDNMRGVGL